MGLSKQIIDKIMQYQGFYPGIKEMQELYYEHEREEQQKIERLTKIIQLECKSSSSKQMLMAYSQRDSSM